MSQIQQYRPAYFEGFENETRNFETLDELKAIPWVKNFMHKGFHQFSRSDEHLMAEYREGKEWWVVGRLINADDIPLPKWEPKK